MPILLAAIRSEQLAKKALVQQAAATSAGSDLPPVFTPSRGPARRFGGSPQGSFPAKTEGPCSPRCDKNDQDDLELGTLSLSHFKDSSPSSPPRPAYSDGIELMHTSPLGCSSFDEEAMATPSKCKKNGMAMLLKSNSLSSMNDGRFNSTPHLLPTLMHANEPDVNFRLEHNLQTYPGQYVTPRGRLGTPEKTVTFHFPAKKSSLPLLEDQGGSSGSQNQQVSSKSSDDKTLKDPEEEKSEVVQELSKALSMLNMTAQGTSRPPGTPRSLHSSQHAAAKPGILRSAQASTRPWTASGATGEHRNGALRLDGQSGVEQLKDGPDYSWQPKMLLDADMPFAGNFLGSSPCRHSDSELRQALRNDKQRPTHTSPSPGSKNTKASNVGRTFCSSDPNVLLSGKADASDWAAFNNALSTQSGSAPNGSPTSSSAPSSQLSPPNSSAGIIRRGKMLAINTARANKFLLRPGSASAGPARAGLDSSSVHFKRRGDKESGRYSPTATSHGSVRWGGLKGAGLPSFGHIEISMQRTTRIDYACEEEPEQACGDLGVATGGGGHVHLGGQDWTSGPAQREKRDVDTDSW